MNAIAKPHITSRVPIVLRYHLDGTLKSSASDSGNTFAYFTYSFLWNKRKKNVTCKGYLYMLFSYSKNIASLSYNIITLCQ